MKNYFILIFSLTITFCSLDSDSSNISDETILPDEEISNESTSATPNDEQISTTSSSDNREIIYFMCQIPHTIAGLLETRIMSQFILWVQRNTLIKKI